MSRGWPPLPEQQAVPRSLAMIGLLRSAAARAVAALRAADTVALPAASAPPLPLFEPSSKVWRLLPRNKFTPEEIAEALRLLADHASVSPSACVTVVWSKKFSRVLRPAEVARINDPERVKRITFDCMFPGVRGGDAATRACGDLIRPPIWGFERRGVIRVEGGGHARSSANAAMNYMATLRLWSAGIRRGLTGAVPAFIIVGAAGAGIPIATFFLAPGGLESPSLFGPTTVAIYITDILLVGLYYFAIFLFLAGTQIVNPWLVVSRSWLTPTVIIGLLALLIAATALVAPVIGVIVTIIKL